MEKNPENGSSKDSSTPVPLLFSCRLTLFIVCMLTTFNFMFQRININFALVCMVKPIQFSHPTAEYNISSSVFQESDNSSVLSFETLENEIEYKNNTEFSQDILSEEQDCKSLIASTSFTNMSNHYDHNSLKEFDWSKEVQSAILGAFYYGFVVTQIPGGWVSDRFGAKKALLLLTAVYSSLTLFNPVAANLGPEYLFVVRLLQGLANGGATPCINVLATRWCGATERTFLIGIASAGFSIASAVTYPISAFLCQYLGWEWIFFVTGSFGMACTIASYFLVFDWPEKHPRIESTELHYLIKNRAVQYGNEGKTKLNVPWKHIIFSRPIMALLIANFCCYWVFLTIVTYLPTFLKEVMGMDISRNGLFSSIPFIMMFVFHFAVSKSFDVARKWDFCRSTNLRKIFNTIGMVVPAICLSTIGLLSCKSQIEAIFLIAIGLSFTEFAFMGGYNLSVFEIAPRFAGIVTGVMCTFGLLTGFVCPALIGYLTPSGSRSEWLMVFYISAFFSIFGSIVYLLFGSSELQPWAAAPSKHPDTELKLLPDNLLDKSNKSNETKQVALHASRP